MMRIFATALLLGCAAFAHETEKAAGPPAGLNAALAGVLQKEGIKVTNEGKVVMELWFRNEVPKSANGATNATITNVPHGALLAVVNFPERGSDRRGQTIKPGLYTARLSFFPPDGNHQGVAPQRDFLLLTPAASDTDPKATPDYETLVKMSMKTTGTPHPAILSVWKVEGEFQTGISQAGEHDWVLQTKAGDLQLAVIVDGQVDH
jgi:hypothetical protein